MNKYYMDTKVDKTIVELAYLFLLGREIESEAALLHHLQQERTIEQLLIDTKNSEEYNVRFNKVQHAIDYYITVQSQNNDLQLGLDEKISDEIILLQTADALKYKDILQISKYCNQQYAKENDIRYQSFMGIKKGYHPHHAMFNRIYLLDEMVKNGYKGWVFYLDADGIIIDKNFKLKQKLSQLRHSRKHFWLHNVHTKEEGHYPWWNINSGAFAIDLASPIAQNAVRTWKGIYENFYTHIHYKNAVAWNDIINDQDSLWKILNLFEIEAYVELEQFQNYFVYQALRNEHNNIASEQDMTNRISKLEAMAKKYYG